MQRKLTARLKCNDETITHVTGTFRNNWLEVSEIGGLLRDRFRKGSGYKYTDILRNLSMIQAEECYKNPEKDYELIAVITSE